MQEFLMDLLFSSENMHDKIKFNELYRRLSDEGVKIYEKLMASLPEGQKEKFLAFTDVQSSLQCNSSETYFMEGFKFGVRLVVQCLCN